jgi:hypothetical protein
MSPSTPDEIIAMHTIQYSEAIGCLTYAAFFTRQDISFAVGQLASFCQKPGKAHWSVPKLHISYLVGTKTHGFLYSRVDRTTFIGYIDSDFDGDKDFHRSTSGFYLPPSRRSRFTKY